MTIRCSWLALAVLAALLVCLPAYQRVRAGQAAPTSQNISLAYNSNGTCTQNGSSGVIDIVNNLPVVYQGATALTQFQVQFTTCPFAASNCPVNSPNGSAVNAGTPTGTVGTTYNYSSITINNQSCKGVSSMGVRVKNP
jgi:hypothetical protein